MGTFQFRTQDGRVFEFQAPDAETATRAFQATFPAPEQPTAPPAQQTAAAPAPTPVTSPMDALDVLDRQAVADVTGVMPTPEEMETYRPAPAPKQQQPIDLGHILETLNIDFQGQRQGLAELPGGLVDIANVLPSMAGNVALTGLDLAAQGAGGVFGQEWGVPFRLPPAISQNPVGGSKFNTDLIESIIPGDPVPYEDMTPAQRVGFEANRFGVSAFLPAALLARLANVPVQQLPRAVEPLTRPYRSGAVPSSDAIAGASGGAMLGAYESQVSEDLQEQFGPLGDILALIGGAVGGNMLEGVARGTKRTIGKAARHMTEFDAPLIDGIPAKSGDMDLAAQYIQSRSGNPAAAANRVNERTASLRPFAESDEAVPTTGIMSDDPGLIAEEKAARQDPDLFPRFARRDQAVERTALRNAERSAPADATGRDFTDTIEQQHAQRVDVAQRRKDWTEEHINTVNARAAGTATEVEMARGGKPAASIALDEPVTTRLTTDQQRKNEAFDAIDPTGTEFRDPSELLRVVDEIEMSMGALNDPSGAPQALMQRIRSLVGEDGTITQVSFKDMQALRPELAGQITAARNSGNYTLADNLTRLKGVLDTEAERLAAQGGEAGARAQEALRVYKDEFAPTWARGPGSEAQRFRQDFNKDRFGRTTTPPSETAGRFIQPGQPEKLADLKRIVGDDERGRKAAGDFLFADLADSNVVSGGRVNPEAVRKWAAKWGDEALNMSQEFRRQLDDLLKKSDVDAAEATLLGRQLKDAADQLAEAKRDTEAARKVLGNDPVNAVASIFESGDPERVMRELMTRVQGNESARNGMKAAIREYLMERATTSGISRTGTGENPLSFANLDRLFKKHERAIAEVYSPEEMHFLRVAHEFLKPLKNLEMSTIPGSQTSPNTRLWETVRRPLEAALKVRYGVLKGGGYMRTIDIARMMLPGGDEGARRLIAQMWFDPDLAKVLLTRDVAKIGSGANNRLLFRVIAAGQGARDLVENREK